MVYKEYDKDKKVHDIYDNPGSLHGNKPETDSASPEACVNRASQHQGLISCAEHRVLEVGMAMMHIGAIFTRDLNAFPAIVN